jgi:DNA-binding NarL/FixJ family response regulator
MPKKVLLVGHCGPDGSYLRVAVRAASPEAIVSCAGTNDELRRAIANGIDLLLINRNLDGDFEQADGIELIQSLRTSDPDVKMMLITNFPEAQAAARAAGALAGFGKKDLGKPAAVAAIKGAL